MKQNVFTKFISLLMALIMVIGMVPTTAFHAHAEGENPLLVIANSGHYNREYTSFTGAVADALSYSSATIQLQSDHTHAERLILKPLNNPELTIDLNGHHLTLSAGLEVTTSCRLIITDTGDTQGSLTINGGNFSPVVLNPDDSYKISLTIDGATLKTEDKYTFIDCYCLLSFYEDNSAVSVVIKNATVSGDDLISAGGNTHVTIQNSTMTARGTVLDMNNNGMTGSNGKEPTKFASASVENSILSGDSVATMEDGTSLTATGTETAPCTFSAKNNGSCISAYTGCSVTLTGVTVEGGFNSMSLSGSNGSFTNCTFDKRINLLQDTYATFTGCTFPNAGNVFNLSSGSTAVCTDCSDFSTFYIDSSRPGGLIVWNEEKTVANVYGEVPLREDLTIPEGVTYNFVTYTWDKDIPAKLVLGDYTVTNNGTIQIDGAVHTHSGEETVESKNDTHHHTKTVCADCPIGYVGYTNEQSHSLDPLTGLCTGCNTTVAVASVTQGENTVYFATFEEALTAVSELADSQALTVKLLEDQGDADTIITLPTNKTFTLDLNGKTLTARSIIHPNGTNLTVCDTSQGAAGILNNAATAYALTGSLTLESGNIFSKSGILLLSTAALTVNGGSITAEENDAIEYHSTTASLTITGGTFSTQATSNAWSVNNNAGSTNAIIRGGIFENGLKANAESTIGAMIAEGYKLVDKNGSTVDMSQSSVSEYVQVVCAHPANFLGSTAATCKDPAYCAQCGESYGEADPTKHNINAETGLCTICEENVAVATVTQNGITTYYLDVESALAAVTGKATIQLLKDSTIPRSANDKFNLPVQDVTLDLNGKTLSADNFVYVPSGGIFTLTDTTQAQTGKLSTWRLTVNSGAELVLTGGTVYGSYNYTVSMEVSGKLTMTGGAVEHVATLASVYVQKNAEVAISGGSVSYLDVYYESDDTTPRSKVTLSGGTFGNIISGFSDDYFVDGIPAEKLLAEGYKFVDATSDADVNANVYSIENVKVVCAHPANFPGSTAADCQNKAYCAQCGESYGEILPHKINRVDGYCQYGCGEFVAVATVIVSGSSRSSFASFADAIAYVEGLTVDDHITIFLHTNTTHDGPWILPNKSIQLNLQGNTLEMLSITNNYSNKNLYISSTTGEGLLKLTNPNGGIHLGGGNVTLLSGNIQATAGNAIMASSGRFTVNGGTIRSDTGHGVYINASTAKVNITGGTIQGGSNSYALYRDQPGTVTLSGGIFLGGINAVPNNGTTNNIVDLVADDYGAFYYDAENQLVGTAVPTDLPLSTSDIIVACVHTMDHADDLVATCVKAAYCGNCQTYYGDVNPDNHDLSLTANDVADVITLTCSRECGYEKQVKLTVPTDAVYDGGPHNATADGSIPGYSAVITYYQSGEELNESPTLPGRYTAKLFLAEQPQYSLSADFSIARATITPYVSVGEGYKKTYDGTTEMPYNTMMVSPTGEDLLGNHNVELNGTWEFASAEAGTTEVTVKITLSGKDAHLYQLSTDTLTGDWGKILPAPLDITADDKTITYGDAAPAFTVKYEGFVSGEDEGVLDGQLNFNCAYDTSYGPRRSAGTYTITPGGLTSNNYTITFQDGALEVKPRQIIAMMDDKVVTYGDDAPEYTWIYDGLVYDDTAEDVTNIRFNGTSAYVPGQTQAGDTVPIMAENLEAVSGNYILTHITEGDLTVMKRPVTASIDGDETKYYDGTDSVPADLPLVLSNIYAADNLFVTGDFAFGQAEAGENIPIIASNLTLDGTDKDNYYLPRQTCSANVGTILPAPLDIIADDKTITYGDTAPAFTVKYEGFAPGEDEGVLGGQLNFNCAYDTSYGPRRSAGTYTITPGGLTSNNYTITFQDGALEVKPRQIIAMMDDKVVTYGDDAPEYTWIYDGLVYDDTAEDVTNIRFNGTSAYVPGQTQAGDTVPIMAENLEAVSGNYILKHITEGDLTVTKRPVTASIDGDETKYYDGTTSVAADLSLALSNIYAADNLFVTGDFAFGQAEAGENIPIIASNLTLDGTDKDNYYLPRQTCSANVGTILPADLNIIADDKTITYGDAAPAFTVKYEGFAPGEDEGVLDGELTFTTAYDVTDPNRRGVTNYGITPGGLTSSNYKISFIDGLLWVERAPVTLLVDETSVVYGDSAPGFTYDFAGLKYEDDAYDVYVGFELYSNYTPETPAGTKLPIQIRNMEAHGGNYAVDQFSGADLTVTKRPVTASIIGTDTKDYDGTTSVAADLDLYLDNVANGDDVSVTGNLAYGQADVGENIVITAKDLTLGGADKDNYYLTSTTAASNAGSIIPLDISGQDISVDKLYYDGTEQTVQVKVPTIDGLEPTVTITGNKATNVGLYELTVTGTGNFTGSIKVPYIIDVDTSDLDAIHPSNVNSDHLDAINEVLDALATVDPAQADQKLLEQWKALEDTCNHWLALIDDAQKAVDTEAINETLEITKDNVKAEDKEKLETALKDLQNALQNHGANYTEEERNFIQVEQERIQETLAALEAVQDVKDSLVAVPETIKPSDMQTVENVLNQYESLSDHEKTLLGEETAKQMAELSQAYTEHEKNILRIYGSNRYQTAINAAYELKASLGGNPFGSVIVARGDCFADALSAGYLADQKDAPILLVNEKTMDMVKAFIRSNTAQGGTVYILGGPEAISPSMESGLESYTVKRLAGTDRYETNLAILKEAGVAGKNLIVCNGGDYPDALSAAALGCPIMLVRNDLTAAQQELLSSTSKQVYIIGGTKAVSTQAEKAMAKQGCTVTRVAGADRYETSAQLAQSVFPNTNSVVLVSGKNYPDALCAGPLARQLGAPVILTAPGKEAAVEKYLADKDVTSAYILGGPKALPYNSADALLEGN